MEFATGRTMVCRQSRRIAPSASQTRSDTCRCRLSYCFECGWLGFEIEFVAVVVQHKEF